ncbi:testis-expressed protein 48 [Dasypus novemcinctus]|uniref:testis-expressed protein 48 n=1 Tax=Dasypus novemcinctus TaxID=9361 RepID=UPI00265F4EFE|nr:testis-expressed protein 48 [Dasypus novemcinctus]
MAAHQKLASKIFCLCCRDCEEPGDIKASKLASQTQEHQPSTCNLKLQKDELDKQNSKHTKETSPLPLGQPLIHPKKRISSSSSEFEDLNDQVSQKGFHKRDLNRYSQGRWPFQPCLIGRP